MKSRKIIVYFCTVLILLAASGCTAGEGTPADEEKASFLSQAGKVTAEQVQNPAVQKMVRTGGVPTAQDVSTDYPEISDKSGDLQVNDYPTEHSPQKVETEASRNEVSPAAADKPGAETGNAAAEDKTVQYNTVCTITIYGSGDIILEASEVEFEEGNSVLDILKMITRSKKIQMEYRGGEKSGAYVEGINNLYEFDCGSESGWMYNVNGWYPNYGCGVYAVKKGDVIEWRYTKDLGKDLGAEIKGR